MSHPPIHGGRLEDACARFGGQPSDWLDLSTGINPQPWPGAEVIQPDWRALPDPQALTRLETAAAAYFGADPALCCAVPGSEAGLRTLGRILEIPAHLAPLTYGTYEQAFPVHTPADRGATARIIANPNNPDGRLSQREDLIDALHTQQQNQGWLIVDEAFADCDPAASVAGLVSNACRLIVTRSFGKFFGLAGVRLGFVIAPEPVLSQIRALQGDWPVCSAAIAFAYRAYADTNWIERTRADLQKNAGHLDALLARHGLQGEGECPLFRLVRVKNAGGLFTKLAAAHILTRPFAADSNLLRFGLPAGPEQFSRLDTALDHWSAHD